jgi:hypothetical protein
LKVLFKYKFKFKDEFEAQTYIPFECQSFKYFWVANHYTISLRENVYM